MVVSTGIGGWADRTAEALTVDAFVAGSKNLLSGWRTRKRATTPKPLWPVIRRKLDALHRARTLQDLRLPAGNRLEPLKGDMAGRFSLRVNDQYRITFQWEQKGPYADDVTCEDYH
jgi:proteic killer suppression protein